jgi:hypothetical protein
MTEKDKKQRRNRTSPAVGVYLDDELNDRFTKGVLKERMKQIDKGEKPTISKSSILKDYIETWLKKNKY